MKHVVCQREECGHPWHVHAPNDGRCRVTGCACDAYRETPVPPESSKRTADVIREAADRIGAGSIVVILPDVPAGPEAGLLSVARAILGNPWPNDARVDIMIMEKKS